jgi:hypothetical protein
MPTRYGAGTCGGRHSENAVTVIRHMEPVFGRLFKLSPYLGIADLGGAFDALAGMGSDIRPTSSYGAQLTRQL